jgi:hypothetical protein
MNDPEQRGLATTARTDDRNELTGRGFEAEIAEDFEVIASAFTPEGLAYVLDPQHDSARG